VKGVIYTGVIVKLLYIIVAVAIGVILNNYLIGTGINPYFAAILSIVVIVAILSFIIKELRMLIKVIFKI